MMNYLELEKTVEFDVYPKRDIVIVKGKNEKVWDDDGKEYIDCIAGHGVASVGHCNDNVIEAVHKQAQTLITCPGIFYNDTRARLLEKLVSITPIHLTKAFLCNSGAESVEAALKFARYTTQKTEFICAMRSFHGRTMGALSATFNPKYREGFEPFVPGFHFVPFNRFEKIKESINENTAGVILEIVQGEGGVNIGDKDYFKQVNELCKERDVLFIADEVQTGFCRTGKMFAIEHYNLEPDMLCIAKAMAGGVPIGAVLCSEKISLPVGKHGTTFGGNPLASAAAIAAIDYMIDNHLADQANEKGNYIVEQFTKHNCARVREVRHLGLMIGIELKEKVKPYLQKLMEEGVLALPAGTTVIRLLPPLTISYEELDFVVEKIVKVLNQGD